MTTLDAPSGIPATLSDSRDRSSCHLRIIDVSTVVDAFASGDSEGIERAAKKLCDEKIEIDRDQLKAEIGAARRTTFVTGWMPQKWVESCYPPGFFGQERFPHWVDPNRAVSQFSGFETQAAQT